MIEFVCLLPYLLKMNKNAINKQKYGKVTNEATYIYFQGYKY